LHGRRVFALLPDLLFQHKPRQRRLDPFLAYRRGMRRTWRTKLLRGRERGG
jgi:hypothetical protein